jgi:hypothetical protein
MIVEAFEKVLYEALFDVMDAAWKQAANESKPVETETAEAA